MHEQDLSHPYSRFLELENTRGAIEFLLVFSETFLFAGECLLHTFSHLSEGKSARQLGRELLAEKRNGMNV